MVEDSTRCDADLGDSRPPSRASNPFATCWTRPGALPFVFPNGVTAESLVACLQAQQWWGEILGPHGSGKSTLLEALQPVLRQAGRVLHVITLRDGQRWLPRGFLAAAASDGARALVMIDGYEQLGWLQRQWLKRCCRRSLAGLLVTSHAPTGLPTLIRLAPDVVLVQQLVATLGKRAPMRITPSEVAASHAVHGGNVREIFFTLYDRHEQLRGAH